MPKSKKKSKKRPTLSKVESNGCIELHVSGKGAVPGSRVQGFLTLDPADTTPRSFDAITTADKKGRFQITFSGFDSPDVDFDVELFAGQPEPIQHRNVLWSGVPDKA